MHMAIIEYAYCLEISVPVLNSGECDFQTMLHNFVNADWKRVFSQSQARKIVNRASEVWFQNPPNHATRMLCRFVEVLNYGRGLHWLYYSEVWNVYAVCRVAMSVQLQIRTRSVAKGRILCTVVSVRNIAGDVVFETTVEQHQFLTILMLRAKVKRTMVDAQSITEATSISFCPGRRTLSSQPLHDNFVLVDSKTNKRRKLS